jgi:hypothetical protein
MQKPVIATVGVRKLQQLILSYPQFEAVDHESLNQLIMNLDTRGDDLKTRWDNQLEVEALAAYLRYKYKNLAETKKRQTEELYHRKAEALGLKGAAALPKIINDESYRPYYYDSAAYNNLFEILETLSTMTFNTRSTLQERSYNFRREQKADENSH